MLLHVAAPSARLVSATSGSGSYGDAQPTSDSTGPGSRSYGDAQSSGDSTRLIELSFSTVPQDPEAWLQLFAHLAATGPPVRARLQPTGPLGLALRLSEAHVRSLSEPAGLARFSRWLSEQGLYVPLVNGSTFGAFQGQQVKEEVFAPDWRYEERFQYTMRLARLLERLPHLREDAGISTLPLSYRPWIAAGDNDAWERMTHNLCRVADVLVRIHQQTGRLVHLDLEPQPHGLLATTEDTVEFYERWLLPHGAPQLAARLGVSEDEAARLLLTHVQVCVNACHAAIVFEEPAEMVRRLCERGIRIGRIRLSSALRARLPDGDRRDIQRALAAFADPTWLHQTVLIDSEGRRRWFPDLPAALAAIGDPRLVELRAHLHLPLYVEQCGVFESTHESVRGLLSYLLARGFTRHVEVETHFSDILPTPQRLDAVTTVEREMRWVMDQLTPQA